MLRVAGEVEGLLELDLRWNELDDRFAEELLTELRQRGKSLKVELEGNRMSEEWLKRVREVGGFGET